MISNANLMACSSAVYDDAVTGMASWAEAWEQNWTRELFTINKIMNRVPTVYKLKDLSGEEIKGTFYKELQKVTDSGYYPVESFEEKEA